MAFLNIIIDVSIKKLDEVVGMNENNVFSDEYVSATSENRESTEDPIIDLVENKGALEFSFKVFGEELIELYKIKKYDDFSKDEVTNYKLPSVKYTHLRFGNISISREYRNKGVSSYIMLKLISTIISHYPQKNF